MALNAGFGEFIWY